MLISKKSLIYLILSSVMKTFNLYIKKFFKESILKKKLYPLPARYNLLIEKSLVNQYSIKMINILYYI